MKNIQVKRTYNINIEGEPSQDVDKKLSLKTISVLPSEIPFIKPKLTVKEGDSVHIGTELFFDKKNPDLKFLSPAAGKIDAIVYGPKRVIECVRIKVDKDEKAIKLIDDKDASVDKLSRETLVDVLHKTGLWGVIRELPFNNIPSADTIPPSIYVTVDFDEPYMPLSEVYLKDRIEEFKLGLSVLSKLSDGKILVGISEKNEAVKSQLGDLVTHTLSGDYPANNGATFLYYNKTTSEENTSWHVKGPDVVRLGQLFMTQQYPVERTIVLAGSILKDPKHLITREGASVSELVGEIKSKRPVRYVVGGVLTGKGTTSEGSLGYSDYAVHVLPEGKPIEALAFVKPGLKKYTFSNTYLGKLFSQMKWEMSTAVNGGERACISCGICPQVCPTDVMPQVLMKEVLGGDIEEAMKQGLLDCSDCGLCTYVCPSKIELDSILKTAKDNLYKELHK